MKLQTLEVNPTLVKIMQLILHTEKSRVFTTSRQIYSKERVKNFCDGGLAIIENFTKGKKN